MKPPPFSYHDPRTVADAVGLLGSLENAKLLAGGQSLMPMLNMRFVLPDHIIDLNRVEGLSYIRANNGALEIGAMTRQREIEFSDAVRERCPLMHEAIRQVGHRQTRNRGTLGGSLCHLDPAAELVTLAAAFDAKVTVAGKSGTRSIDFASFPGGLYDAGDRAGRAGHRRDLPVLAGRPWLRLRRILAPARRFRHRVGGRADRRGYNGKVTRASVTLGGMGPAPVRAREVEKALIGEVIEEKRLREICESLRKCEAIEDIHAPASYRQQLATVLSRRALLKAHERIAEGKRA